ncbi:hypothetical protein [Chelativorans sp.]|uniref:hypothetical protein n=1 Tax=Chelativorans sp. TaxID=2203393 RepID=UPI0028112419|nr:hypothetical protein [Chelativorans sp.]
MRRTLLIAALGLASVLAAATVPAGIALAQSGQSQSSPPSDDAGPGGCEHRKKEQITS